MYTKKDFLTKRKIAFFLLKNLKPLLSEHVLRKPWKTINLHLCLTLGFCASKSREPQWGCRFPSWALMACPGLTARLQIGNAVLSLLFWFQGFMEVCDDSLSWLSRDFRKLPQTMKDADFTESVEKSRQTLWIEKTWFPSHYNIRNSSFQQQVPRHLKKQGCTRMQGLPWGSSDFKCTRQRL